MKSATLGVELRLDLAQPDEASSRSEPGAAGREQAEPVVGSLADFEISLDGRRVLFGGAKRGPDKVEPAVGWQQVEEEHARSKSIVDR